MERAYSLKKSIHDEGGVPEKPAQGFYTFQITNYKERDKEGNFLSTKNGDPKVGVICEIVNESKEEGKSVFHNVIFYLPDSPGIKGIGITRKFLKCINEPWEGDLKPNLDSWIGKRFQAELIYNNGYASLVEIQECEQTKPMSNDNTRKSVDVNNIVWED